VKIPRLIIAGTNSGVGKTTIATGVMAALTKRGLKVQAYKTGPDYIDPGYHTLVTKRPSRNLDAFMLQPQTLATLFVKAAAEADIVIIEGVMGLFDGGVGGVGSTANLAKQLKAPVVLIVDVRAMADSAAALVYGFARFDPEVQVAGVILNRVGSERHYRMVKEAIEDKVGVPVLGYLTKNTTLTMPERHLGLLPVEENNDLQWYEDLAKQIEKSIDLERMLVLAQAACPLAVEIAPALSVEKTVRIAVARDEAFTFYYQDGLDELESLGVELVPFSPLRDATLPGNVCGLLFGGGFPEMFVKELSGNRSMQESIRAAHRNGMPIYAECGGLMYLCREIADFDGVAHSLVGLVPAVCQMEKKLVTVGYVEVEARQDTVLCSRGEKLRGHEFHFSTMEGIDDGFPWAFTFRKLRDGSEYPGGYCDGNLLASYLHCHFAGNPEAASYFVNKCMEYGNQT
jgi:cobyrinic acid a,c-diamide synthase